MLDFKQLNKYVTWKNKYEKNAKKSYKWPVFQVFLQQAITKIALRQSDPEPQLLYYGLQFLRFNDRGSDSFLDFGYPETTPFSSSALSLLKSLKIFGVVKLEFLRLIGNKPRAVDNAAKPSKSTPKDTVQRKQQ